MTQLTEHSLVNELKNAFHAIPFNQLLGLKIQEINDEHITLTFQMKKELIGNYLQGILHGGVISSVLDAAGGVTAMLAIIAKNPSVSLHDLTTSLKKSGTINLNIDYLRPGKGENFLAKAWIIQAGNKICFARMECYNQENLLIATGSGTYLIG